MIEELHGELYLYNLLRQIFLSEPNREFLVDLSRINAPSGTDPIAQGLQMLAGSAKKNEARLDEWLQELSLEYARLFIGPVKLPAVPYASFYLSDSRQLMTEETIDVRKKYLEAGMALKELYSVPDDHVGIELEFLFYLTGEIIKLSEQNRSEEASRLFEQKTDFIREHMLPWVPIFAAKVIDSTQEEFYRGAAFMLNGSVQS